MDGDPPRRWGAAELARLIDELTATHDEVWGPRLVDEVIDRRPIDSADDLPVGWGDEQAPGRYRLRRRDDEARFGYAVGPSAPKRQLLPPRHEIWSSDVVDGERVFTAAVDEVPRRALVGVRACELAAMARQDRVLLGGVVSDPVYGPRREALTTVAVECSSPAATCFCPSVGTGPAVGDEGGGADLVLTEVVDDGEPWYLARATSPTGAELIQRIGGATASDPDLAAAAAVVAAAAAASDRGSDADGVRGALTRGHDEWDPIAARCVACGNCTNVCPTCFCTTVVDHTELDSDRSSRERLWDSCFSLDFSHLTNGPVRPSVSARYRHWITHKLSSWVDQFGELGCVGCGRCTTWCPMGIDLVAEAGEALERDRRRIPVASEVAP